MQYSQVCTQIATKGNKHISFFFSLALSSFIFYNLPLPLYSFILPLILLLALRPSSTSLPSFKFRFLLPPFLSLSLFLSLYLTFLVSLSSFLSLSPSLSWSWVSCRVPTVVVQEYARSGQSRLARLAARAKVEVASGRLPQKWTRAAGRPSRGPGEVDPRGRQRPSGNVTRGRVFGEVKKKVSTPPSLVTQSG